MKHGAIVALVVATAFAVVRGQPVASTLVAYPNFPFCLCNFKSVSPFSIEPTIKAFGNGTYCFTLDAYPAPVPSNCKSDIKKIEINVNKACNVFNPIIKTTINGVPTRVGAAFDAAPQGPPDATVLRISQLNLGVANDGAQICLTLGLNSNGRGCATLEDLCVPPAGAPPGACSLALFDTTQNCCPISKVNVPSPPPSPPAPPPPPPPPPSETTCTSCTYVTFTDKSSLFGFSITNATCASLAKLALYRLKEVAEEYGASIIPNTEKYDCFPTAIKFCVTFASQVDGQKVQPVLPALQAELLDVLFPGGACPAYLTNIAVVVTTAADGPDPFNPPPSSCLSGTTSFACAQKSPDFPKCQCDTRPKVTAFAALPYLTKQPGRPSNKTNATLYCFNLVTVDPIDPTSSCGSSSLLKAEIWGNDIGTQRRKIISIGIQASDWPNMRWQAPSWGKTGEQTLKASPLNWSTAQAQGAQICLELSDATDINTFCNYGGNTCWINFFSPDKACCPLYAATLPF